MTDRVSFLTDKFCAFRNLFCCPNLKECLDKTQSMQLICVSFAKISPSFIPFFAFFVYIICPFYLFTFNTCFAFFTFFAKLSFNFNFNLVEIWSSHQATHPWNFIFRTFFNPIATTTSTWVSFYLNTTNHDHLPGIVVELQLWLQLQLLTLTTASTFTSSLTELGTAQPRLVCICFIELLILESSKMPFFLKFVKEQFSEMTFLHSWGCRTKTNTFDF